MAPALRVSEAAAMALHTMAFLALQNQRIMSTHELAGMLSGSEAHLSKVLQRLTKAGLISSSRGPKGGFILARPAETIKLLEIWEAIDGPVGDIHCMQNPPVCDGTTCLFGALVKQVNQLVRESLGGTMLSDLSYDHKRLLRKTNRARRSAK